jgi:hypothetical protein
VSGHGFNRAADGSLVSGHEFTRAAPCRPPKKRKSHTPTRVMLSVCAKHPSARISPRDGGCPILAGFGACKGGSWA